MTVVPHGRLPISDIERHAALRTYFCDKDAEATPTAEGWKLSFAWPDGAHRHVDPALPQGLSWWDPDLRLDGMALARRRSGRILRSLYDTWTLHSWTEWLARRGITPLDGVTILHVDDHRDLGTPRLFIDDRGWLDAISGQRCDFRDPESVQSAIESGAIGMGSFLTPFLHTVPNSEVRHLCQPPKVQNSRRHRIRLTAETDTLLDPARTRPAIRLESDALASGPGTYLVTADTQEWLRDLSDQPILLHIDMDYFNNRYDGDSDWAMRSPTLDPPQEEIHAKIMEMTAHLRATGALDRIEDIVIAYSPGFFPAEHWAMADRELTGGLQRPDAD